MLRIFANMCRLGLFLSVMAWCERMADMNQNLTCRQALADAFQALSDEAVKAGWPEGDVALALAELAEERVIELTAKVIMEGFIDPPFIAAGGRRNG